MDIFTGCVVDARGGCGQGVLDYRRCGVFSSAGLGDFCAVCAWNLRGCEMKPAEKKPDVVFRIVDRATGEACGSYSRAYCDEFDFQSPSEARNANCNGKFEDKNKYAIAKYRVIYELVESDVDK